MFWFFFLHRNNVCKRMFAEENKKNHFINLFYKYLSTNYFYLIAMSLSMCKLNLNKKSFYLIQLKESNNRKYRYYNLMNKI